MVSISPSLCFCARAKFNLQHFAQRSLLPAGPLQRVSSTRMKRDSHFLKSSSPLVSSLYTFHRESWNSFPATITESNPKTATRIVSFDQPSSPPTFCLHYQYYWHSKVPPQPFYSTCQDMTTPDHQPTSQSSTQATRHFDIPREFNWKLFATRRTHPLPSSLFFSLSPPRCNFSLLFNFALPSDHPPYSWFEKQFATFRQNYDDNH